MTAHNFSARLTASSVPKRYTHMSSDFVLRTHVTSNVAHYYRKQDLRDPEVVWVTPWCEEGKANPERHRREDVGPIERMAAARHAGCLYRAIP